MVLVCGKLLISVVKVLEVYLSMAYPYGEPKAKINIFQQNIFHIKEYFFIV